MRGFSRSLGLKCGCCLGRCACIVLCCADVIDHRTASDLVAHVREQSPKQSPPQVPPVGQPSILTDDSPHPDNDDNDNTVEVTRDDNNDFQQQRRQPADLWTPPLPPPARSTTPDRRVHGLRPAVETTATPPTPRHERRPVPGGSSGTQWWNGGLKSSSVRHRPTTGVAVAMFTVVFMALHTSTG